MSELKSVVVNYALENEKNLEIAYVTNEAFSDIIKQIIGDLKTKLKEKLLEGETFKSNDWIFVQNNDYFLTFLISNRKWPSDLVFGIFEHNDKDKVCFSAGFQKETHSKLLPYLSQIIKGSNNTSYWWFKRLKDEYNRWREDYKGVQGLYKSNSDQFLEYVVPEIIELANILEAYFSQNPVD